MRRNLGPGLPLADDAESSTFFAVTCNDTDWPQGREHGDHLSAELGPRYPLVGWSVNENPCYFWDRPSLTMPVPTGEGLPPTLMVQADHDPATNASLAVAAHQQYAGSRLVRVVGEGDHGIYGGVNKCVDKLVDTFLTTGRRPRSRRRLSGRGHPRTAARAATGTGRGPGAPATGRDTRWRDIAELTKSVSGF